MRKRGARKGWRWRAWALPVAVLAAVFAVPPMRTQSPAQPPLSAGSASARPALLPAGGNDGFVDAQVCAGCHSEIWETYRQTGMGRSFDSMTAANARADFKEKNRYLHHASKRHYTAYEQDGQFFQRRHQVSPDGSEINIVEKQIHYIVGSGNHARSYLHRTPDGRLLQLPLTWYSEKGGSWAMSPGYDRPDHSGFRRVVSFECMACHNAYPEIEPGSDSLGHTPVFAGRIPKGIDCQRCHGPGRAHLDALQRGAARDTVIEAVVNPAWLSPEREIEVCMQCHLETTSRDLPHSIVRYGRGFFSYRAGRPLADFMLHFDHAPGTGNDDKFEVVQSVYRLRQSQCFQASGGRMTCTTCHDPHHAPRGEQAAAQYSKACRNCHSEMIASKIEANEHPAATECVRCHMPRRRTEDAVHSVSVDHLIQRRPPDRDLLAPLQERPATAEAAYQGEVVAYYPEDLHSQPEGELYLAVAQVKDGADLSRGIPRLEAAVRRSEPQSAYFHFELGEAYLKAGLVTDAVRAFRTAVAKEPSFLAAQKSLGLALLLTGDHAAAAQATEQALTQEPQNAEIHNTLGEIRYREKKLEAAERHFRDAIRLDPDLPQAHNNLGATRLLAKDSAGAEASFREAVRIQPDFAAARTNLAQVRGGGGEAGRTKDATETDAAPIEELVARAESAEQENDLAEAARLYERILEQRPDWAAVKLNLGLVYYSQQRYPEAVRILSQVVEQEPELRSAMLFLGASYYNLDRYAEAVPLLEQYLALEPASEEARPFLAASYYALNEYEASALQYLLQISLTPDNAALYFHLGEAYSAMAAALARRLEDQSSDAPAASSGNSGYHWLLTTVQQSLDEKNFALAESRLGEALALDPENNEGRLANGYYRLANGDLAAAKADFETILGNDPGHCRALQGLVDVSMGLEDRAGAAEAIRRLLAIWPACLTYTVKDSDQELQTDFSGADAARTKCRQAVAKRSFGAEAAGRVERTLVMASCLEIQGAVPAATSTLLSTLPERPRSRYLSFQILLRLAQRAYGQSARLAPNSALLAGLRAQEFERQGNLESADAVYQNAILAAGSDPQTLVAYAQFKARIGKSAEAAPLLDQALRASPHHPRANAMLGDVFLSLDRAADAIPLFRRAVELNPGDEPSRRKLASALDESGQLDEAILILESAPADSDGQIHFLLGNMYRRKGERQKAIDALRIYQQRRRPAESSQ